MKERRFALPDGRTLTWFETGAGPPLVLLHGWSLGGLVFAELAELLGERFRVLCPDLPGHGRSMAGADLSFSGLADDLRCWLNGVAPQPVLLGGWSLGGMLAMELAARSETPPAGLLLLSYTPRFTRSADWPYGLPSAQLKAMQRNLARRFEATLAGFFELAFAGEDLPIQRLQEIRRFAIYPGQLPEQRAAAAMLEFLAIHDQRPLLVELVLPTLIIQGELDRITLPGAAAYLQAKWPHAQLEMFTDCSHAPFWSRPEQVAEAITENLV